MAQTCLINPYGGRLVDLRVTPEKVTELKDYATHLPSLQLNQRQMCDLELLAVGGFSPLDRFMSQADHQCVVNEMRLSNGQLFPLPITLPIFPSNSIHIGQEISLRSPKNELLALMKIEEIYEWDRDEVSETVFGTLDTAHPIVSEMRSWGPLNISGELRVIQLPPIYDFRDLRMTPAQTRARLEKLGYENVVAFQTRNPLHRVHEELTKRAIEEVNGVLLLHPVVGITRPGDVDHYIRVRTYKTLTQNYYNPDRILLALLPLAMRMGGPREGVLHAIIRRNYGANHLIVGRDHAGPGNDSNGKPFYGPSDAQQLIEEHSQELGVKVIPFRPMAYIPDEDRYEEISKIPEGTKTLSLSGTQVREDFLENGKPLPPWFTRPEVAAILSSSYLPRHRQGLCIWFTGLSGSGKTTTADLLTSMLLEYGRQVTVLDGDVVRTHLSSGLGFSKEERDANIHRIGFVASEIVRHSGVVICAAISPYHATRNDVRNLVGNNFVEVFMNTPLEVCEARDTKGLYAKARRGEITGFTGIDDPYEEPLDAEIVLETVDHTPEENAQAIISYLLERGFIKLL